MALTKRVFPPEAPSELRRPDWIVDRVAYLEHLDMTIRSGRCGSGTGPNEDTWCYVEGYDKPLKFKRAVLSANGAEWLDFIDEDGATRSVRYEQVEEVA